MPKNLKDALLKATLNLPNGAAATTSTGIDTGVSATGEQPGSVEYLLTTPALTTAQLPNAATMTYDIITSANSDLSSPTTLLPGVVVQTGAGGVGATAATPFRFRLPSTTAKQFLGFKATNSGAGNASAAAATLEAVF